MSERERERERDSELKVVNFYFDSFPALPNGIQFTTEYRSDMQLRCDLDGQDVGIQIHEQTTKQSNQRTSFFSLEIFIVSSFYLEIRCLHKAFMRTLSVHYVGIKV